jgi:hypothetical protein
VSGVEAVGSRTEAPRGPMWRIAFLFHADLGLLSTTLPRCLEALTASTTESYDVVLLADGTPEDVAAELPSRMKHWGVDEVRLRRRDRHVASGDPSNNGHCRFFPGSTPYLIVVEDDVVMYRTECSFDVLMACRELFERHPDVPVLSKMNDYDKWSWRLADRGPAIEVGVRSVVHSFHRLRRSPFLARCGALRWL